MEQEYMQQEKEAGVIQEKKEIKVMRFDNVLEGRLLKIFSKMFNSNGTSEEIAMALEKCNIIDPAHVLLINAKSEEAKRFLARYIDDPTNISKIPFALTDRIHFNAKDIYTDMTLDGSKGDKNLHIDIPYSRSVYSTDYMFFILSVFKAFDQSGYDHFSISIGTDTPAVFENDHIKILIAPRIESE